MVALRILIVLGLLGGLFCFARYAWSGDVRWRRFGLRVTGWTIAVAIAFFMVLFVQRVVEMMAG